MDPYKDGSRPTRKGDDIDERMAQLKCPSRGYRQGRFLTLADVALPNSEQGSPSAKSPRSRKSDHVHPAVPRETQSALYLRASPPPQTPMMSWSSVPSPPRPGRVRSPSPLSPPQTTNNSPRVDTRPLNVAWVVIQGRVQQADWDYIHSCLHRMGFQQIHIKLSTEETLTKEEVEDHVKGINCCIQVGANLLLMAASRRYNGVQLGRSFLLKEVYTPIALFNNEVARKCRSALRRHLPHAYHEPVFDTRIYEGVTLHVVLDGVPGVYLPHSLELSSNEGTNRGPEVDWIGMPELKGKSQEALRLNLESGRLVQLWRDGDTFGYQPYTLFSAFLSVHLTEPYLPYNVLLHRLEELLRTPLPRAEVQPVAPLNRTSSSSSGMVSRMIGADAGVLELHFFISSVMKARDAKIKQRVEQRWQTDIAAGKALFTCASQFDPFLCFDVNWKD